jgi:hypothetical protein
MTRCFVSIAGECKSFDSTFDFEEGLDMEHALATKLDLVNLIPPVLDGP